jgi:sensor histidine kinase regulating citrate/malate metabolism
MKKLIGIVVAVGVAAAFAAYAGTTTPAKKSTEMKTTVTETKSATETDVKAVTTEKQGPVAKETVTFNRYDKSGDWIYVMKDNKEIRLKHTLSDSDKKDMLGFKKGDAVTVTSTYPLTNSELATVLRIQKAQPIKK